MGLLSNTWIGCLLTMLPGPPGIKFHNAYFQMFPIDKLNIHCPELEYGRDITFRFYLRYFPDKPQELRISDDKRLLSSGFDFSLPTVIYFPPFFEGADGMSVSAVREAYLSRGGYNFIFVDSKRLSAGPWYPTAVTNTYVIGRHAAQFIDYLVSKGLPLDKIHFIGMSIGAHAAGVAGHFMKSGKVSRITGLDPASLLFSDRALTLRLDPSDAQFVDVIHTDGIFGITTRVGHVDFYVNSGKYPQPGCQVKEVAKRTKRVLFTVFCGHLRSNELYAKSVIYPTAFPAVQCSSWTKYKRGECNFGPVEFMGIDASPTARGIYYVSTGTSSSFAEETNNDIT